MTAGREPPGGPAFVRYSKYGALAFEFLGAILAGVFIGSQLDRHFGTDPWLVLGMTIAGTAIGFYRMVQILRRFERTL
ncbi:MAG: AtpZ/AtpI family protein [Deltaproteobacteria bacterium]|nr:AtpZ/AtpI family protein [Deltaproteobacteria bacterium]